MPKADINKAGWEQSEFPILCETCELSPQCPPPRHVLTKPSGLGDNPFVRMVRPFYWFGKILQADLPGVVKTRVWSRLWHLCTSIHRLPLEPRYRHALQDHSYLPDLRQDQECLPNMST